MAFAPVFRRKDKVSRQETMTRLRNIRSPRRSPKKFSRDGIVQTLTIGIVILVMIQLTTMVHQSLDAINANNDMANVGPVYRALRDQRNGYLNKHSQELASAQETTARRRLNATHNKSEAIVPQPPVEHVEVVMVEPRNQTKQGRPRKRQHNVAIVTGPANATHVAITGTNRTSVLNRTSSVAIQKVKRKMRPFALMRSVPEPPKDFGNRTMPVDVLRDPGFKISKLNPTNYTLRSKWHGVLLDAGRHYFEVSWIYRMLDVLAVLQYNCLHFRLTDDQAWNVRLKSQPSLAHPVGIMGHNNVYTPDELREIVAYAKTKGITVWPEINVPGHGGGWAGIPGMIVQCPEFICEKGYGIPINVTHPKFRGVLRDVLQEIIDIFDHPPYLHLGGDEVDMAMPCFQELGQDMFDYNNFEMDLKSILDDIGYPEEQVIRWEMTGQRLNSPQTGKLPQYWFRIPGESGPDWGKNKFLASGGLYFDFNEMDMAWKVFLHTRRYYHLPRDNFPLGIVVGTFELDAQFWFDRNVVGRLLAVTMGAANEVEADNGDELYSLYRTACRGVGFDDSLCNHYGLPFVSWHAYKAKWTNVWTMWKGRICDRLTSPVEDFLFVRPGEQATKERRSYYMYYRQFSTNTRERFWDVFGAKDNSTVIDFHTSQFDALQHKANFTSLMNRLVLNAGIVLDLTLPTDPETDVSAIPLIRQMHALGLNLIQLRLANDRPFAYKSDAVPQVASLEPGSRPSLDDIKNKVVAEATRMSIGIMPEISLSTHAAGLYELDQNVACPRYTCDTGHGVQNIANSEFIATAYSLVREIESIATSGMIHLGSDERVSGTKCYTEARSGKPDFDEFEKKLSHLLAFDGITSQRIVRWSNEESIEYPGRLGGITQCRKGDCRTDAISNWIATVDIGKGGAFDVYNEARELALRKPFSILAEIGKMDRLSIDANQIPKRILAFTMGISDLSEWSRGMFEETFTSLCDSLFGIYSGCNDFAKSDSGIEGAGTRDEDDRKALCESRTTTVIRRLYRAELQEQAVSVEVKTV